MDILKSLKDKRFSNRIAVENENESISYFELNKKSDELSVYFNKKYSDDRPIVVYGNKENLFLISIFASLKSGHAYIPIDISFPIERIRTIVNLTNPCTVVNCTDNQLQDIDCLNKEEIDKIFNEFSNQSLPEDEWVKDDENAYILFTSGSTGAPKGVQISANNLKSFGSWTNRYMKINNNEERILNAISYSFDFALSAYFIGILNGKTLLSISHDTLIDLGKLFNRIELSNIDIWVSTPSLANILLNSQKFNKNINTKLNKFIFAGEVLPKPLVKELRNRFENSEIINAYGPTEATNLLSACFITDDMINCDKAIPVGPPKDDMVMYAIDENGNKVEDLIKGELVAIGPTISKGYLNNKNLSDKVFFEKEIDGITYRGYKTGDIVYFENGIINFCGRKDFQIKMHGFRIEIEDIENNIRKINNVENAVVMPIYKLNEISHLTAFVKLKEKNDLSNIKNAMSIKSELSKYIPSYMIPRNFIFLDKFPENQSGKIDRKKLKEVAK